MNKVQELIKQVVEGCDPVTLLKEDLSSGIRILQQLKIKDLNTILRSAGHRTFAHPEDAASYIIQMLSQVK